jgi:zinc protease
MFKRTVPLILALLVSFPLAAQSVRIEHFELPNGLDVVLNEDHNAPLVAINVWYHVGSKNEKPGRTGFAHLFEHMLFSGSQNVGPNEHFRHVQSVGGVLNGSTTLDRTNYYETMPSNYLALGLWLEADRMGFFLPTLSQERLDVQKNVVKEERRQRYENVPYGLWLENLLRLGHPSDHPYSWPTIGSMADLTAAQLEDVKDFFRRYYAPNNAVLTISGDFDPAEAKALVTKYFGDIPRGPQIERPTPVRTRLTTEARDVIEGAVQLPRVYRLYHVPRIGEPGWHAASLLQNILVNGKASRLERALVLEQQIAQDVQAFVWDAEVEGMLLLWATAKQGVTPERLEAALDAEINRIAREGVSEAELTRAKNQTETDYAHQLEDVSSRADLISMLTTYLGDPRIVNTWMDRFNRITRDDIQQIARTFGPSDRVTLHYVPQRRNLQQQTTGGAQ